MALKILMYPLAHAAQLCGCSEDHLLERAANREIRLCVRVPEDKRVYSVAADTLKSLSIKVTPDKELLFSRLPLKSWYEEPEIEYLILSAADCEGVVTQSPFPQGIFLAGYIVSGQEEVREIFPTRRGNRIYGEADVIRLLYSTHQADKISSRPLRPVFQSHMREPLGGEDGRASFSRLTLSKDQLWISADQLACIQQPETGPVSGLINRSPLKVDSIGMKEGSKTEKPSGKVQVPNKPKAVRARELILELLAEVARRAEQHPGALEFDSKSPPGECRDLAALFYAWTGAGTDKPRFDRVSPDTFRDYTKIDDADEGEGKRLLQWRPGARETSLYDTLFPELAAAMADYKRRYPRRKKAK